MASPTPKPAQHLYEAVRDLASELIVETDGREQSASATAEAILLAAGTFPRYRLTTLPIISQSDLMARSTSLRDLRELGRRSFPEMQLIMQLLSHFTPLVGRNSANTNGPPYE